MARRKKSISLVINEISKNSADKFAPRDKEEYWVDPTIDSKQVLQNWEVVAEEGYKRAYDTACYLLWVRYNETNSINRVYELSESEFFNDRVTEACTLCENEAENIVKKFLSEEDSSELEVGKHPRIKDKVDEYLNAPLRKMNTDNVIITSNSKIRIFQLIEDACDVLSAYGAEYWFEQIADKMQFAFPGFNPLWQAYQNLNKDTYTATMVNKARRIFWSSRGHRSAVTPLIDYLITLQNDANKFLWFLEFAFNNEFDFIRYCGTNHLEEVKDCRLCLIDSIDTILDADECIYKLGSNGIRLRQDSLVEELAIEPVLNCLREYPEEANENFLKALKRRREGDIKGCITSARSALETVLKAIESDRKGNDPQNGNIERVIRLLPSIDKGVSQLSEYIKAEVKTLDKIRNGLSDSHGHLRNNDEYSAEADFIIVGVSNLIVFLSRHTKN